MALAALSLLAAQGRAETLKIATLAPDGTTWMRELRAGAEEVARRTGGRVQIKFYPGGVMGDADSVMRKMRIGQLHGGAFTGGALATVHPDAEIYGLPFLFSSYEEVDYVRERVDPVIAEHLAAEGIQVLGISEGGFATLFSQEPIRSLGDARGKKAWVGETDRLTQIIYAEAGASPVSLPLGDVYTGLQTGLIDTVAGTPTAVLAFQWHTKIEYMTDVKISYLVGLFGLQKRAFDRLAEQDRQVLAEVMGEVFERLDRLNRQDNAEAREALRAHGIGLVVPDAGELRNWRALADEAVAQLIREDRIDVDTLALIRRHLETYREGAREDDGG